MCKTKYLEAHLDFIWKHFKSVEFSVKRCNYNAAVGVD